MGDWQTIAQAFAIGGFPWISQFKKLNIHFSSPAADVPSISNFFASLFATSIFAYLQYAHPAQAIALPAWWVEIAVAAVLCIIFFGHYLYQRKRVEQRGARWPILVHFVLYILIFSTLTAGFGTLKLLDAHYHHKGIVLDAKTNAGVPRANVRVIDENDALITAAISDAKGEYSLLILKSDAARILKLEVITSGYADMTINVADPAHLLGSLRDLQITHQ